MWGNVVLHLDVKMHLPVSSNPGQSYSFLPSPTSHPHLLCCYTEQARRFALTDLTALPWEASKWIPPFETALGRSLHKFTSSCGTRKLQRQPRVILWAIDSSSSMHGVRAFIERQNPWGTGANRCSGCIIYVINYGALNSLMPALIHTAATQLLAGGLYFYFFNK